MLVENFTSSVFVLEITHWSAVDVYCFFVLVSVVWVLCGRLGFRVVRHSLLVLAVANVAMVMRM